MYRMDDGRVIPSRFEDLTRQRAYEVHTSRDLTIYTPPPLSLYTLLSRAPSLLPPFILQSKFTLRCRRPYDLAEWKGLWSSLVFPFSFLGSCALLILVSSFLFPVFGLGRKGRRGIGVGI